MFEVLKIPSVEASVSASEAVGVLVEFGQETTFRYKITPYASEWAI